MLAVKLVFTGTEPGKTSLAKADAFARSLLACEASGIPVEAFFHEIRCTVRCTGDALHFARVNPDINGVRRELEVPLSPAFTREYFAS